MATQSNDARRATFAVVAHLHQELASSALAPHLPSAATTRGRYVVPPRADPALSLWPDSSPGRKKHTRVRAGIVRICVRFIISESAVRFNLIARTSVRSIDILIYGAPSPPGVLAQVERRGADAFGAQICSILARLALKYKMQCACSHQGALVAAPWPIAARGAPSADCIRRA